jgi:hypothetical protein
MREVKNPEKALACSCRAKTMYQPSGLRGVFGRFQGNEFFCRHERLHKLCVFSAEQRVMGVMRI